MISYQIASTLVLYLCSVYHSCQFDYMLKSLISSLAASRCAFAYSFVSNTRVLQTNALSAMLKAGQQTCSSRTLLARQHTLSAFPSILSPHSRRFSSHQMQLNSSRRQDSWQIKAEAGGGGGSSGAGGKKGYSSGDGSGSSGDGGLWGTYTRMLETNPLLVKAITTAILSAVGNIICQVVIEKQPQLDWKRLNTFTALGFVWVAPCLHFWFGALNRIITAQGNAGAIMRMALDQLGFAPIFIGSMIAILTTLDGKADRVVETLKADLPSAVKANWMLWVPAQFLNFRFVPANYQVLFANVVALAWNVYFSFATRPKEATA